MIACWYKTYIRRFGEETEKKVTCNPRPNDEDVSLLEQIAADKDWFSDESDRTPIWQCRSYVGIVQTK